jgi:protein N-terminal methyltransferase
MIFIKENICSESPEDGVTERSIWDDEDHSITRSTNAYQRVFREAGLELVDTQVQLGLPEELFVVKMWALK